MKKIFILGITSLISLLSIDQTYGQCGAGRCPAPRRENAARNGWWSQEGGFQGPYRGNYPGQYNEEHGYPEFRTDDDQRLFKKIRRAVHNYFSGKYDHLWISLNSGSVLIRGSVDNERDQKDLLEILRDVRGVNNINNQTTIGESRESRGQMRREDRHNHERDQEERSYGESRERAGAVRQASDDSSGSPSMASPNYGATSPNSNGTDRYTTPADKKIMKNIRDSIVDYPTLMVNVNNGDVDLSGTVETQADKEKIERRVRATEGVRNIKNNIMVR